MALPVRWTLILLAVAGLVIDAYTHVDLDHVYAFNSPGWVNEGVLFQIEGLLAAAAAAWLLARPSVWSAGFSAALAGGGAALLVLYRYVDVGEIGPIPNMHEPIWFDEKVWCLVGELVAFGASALLVVLLLAARRRREPAPTARAPVA